MKGGTIDDDTISILLESLESLRQSL